MTNFSRNQTVINDAKRWLTFLNLFDAANESSELNHEQYEAVVINATLRNSKRTSETNTYLSDVSLKVPFHAKQVSEALASSGDNLVDVLSLARLVMWDFPVLELAALPALVCLSSVWVGSSIFMLIHKACCSCVHLQLVSVLYVVLSLFDGFYNGCFKRATDFF